MMPEIHEQGFNGAPATQWDSPKEIVDGFIREQQRIVSGYGGNERVKKELWEEAKKPRHVALSLTGETILYAHLLELLKEFHSRGISTFLVTNGIYPQVVRKMIWEKVFPTQFYASMSAWDEASYNNVCRPLIPNAWSKFLETLELLKQMQCRTVIRMTLVKNLNMEAVKEYAELIKSSNAHYVECKAFMSVGPARERLGLERMPLHSEIQEFARELAKETGYVHSAEHEQSRCVLLCRDGEAQKNRLIDFEKISV